VHDHLGSSRGVYNSDKTHYAALEYTPYGELYASSGSISGITRRYTGHDWDDAAELYYAPYRYYAPGLARWLTRDPLGMVDGPNVYGYVRGKPVKQKDTLGLVTTSGCCGEEGVSVIDKVERACDNLENHITDESLLKCLQERCRNSVIVCHDKCKSQSSEILGFNHYFLFWRSKKAHLCMGNIEKHGCKHLYGEIVIHEWAHSCGWNHNEGKGVPGDSGGFDCGSPSTL